MFRRKKDGASSGSPLSVCLIGCGPAGMSLLHALRAKKEGLDRDSAEYAALPKITCYEQAAGPGGAWKDVPENDPSRKEDENKVLMYNDLWCNVPKELMEYYDYTWDEHFKKATPSYLPRKDVLEYLIARNSRDGALDKVKYNHEVEKVSYDEGEGQFVVKVKDHSTGKSSTKKFDRCVWAGGMNGEAEKPAELMELLAEFEGKIIHSTEACESFDGDVKGKKLMFIGDSSSAEDLALRAVKSGAKQVTICSRSADGDAYETASWPKGKVKVEYGIPYKVMKGKDFKCQAIYWSEKRQKWRKDEDEEPFKVKDIDIVVLCTGYDHDLDYIDVDIRFDPEEEWQVSKGWIMDNNALTNAVGNVTPSKNLEVGATVYPGVYRGLLIANPKMMYLTETEDVDAPILELDVDAHLILGYLTGEVDIPKEKEMTKANQKQLEAEMQLPWLRERMDNAYADEIDELDDQHWSDNPNDERSLVIDRKEAEFKIDRIARDARAGSYPIDFGKPSKLNAKGEVLVEALLRLGKVRANLKKDGDESSWRTFRDTDGGDFESFVTGTKCTALPGHWMDLKLDKAEPKLSSIM